MKDSRDGRLTFEVESLQGRHVRADTSHRRFRERYAKAAAEERELVAQDVRSAGADHILLSTGDDWLRPLVLGLANRQALR